MTQNPYTQKALVNLSRNLQSAAVPQSWAGQQLPQVRLQEMIEQARARMHELNKLTPAPGGHWTQEDLAAYTQGVKEISEQVKAQTGLSSEEVGALLYGKGFSNKQNANVQTVAPSTPNFNQIFSSSSPGPVFGGGGVPAPQAALPSFMPPSPGAEKPMSIGM